MEFGPHAFLKRAVEMGLIDPAACAQAELWLREAPERGGSFERHLIAKGLLDIEGVGRIVQELRRSGKTSRGARAEGATEILSTAERSPSGSASPPAPDSSGIVSAPESRYRLQQVLGRGGMGEVWLALDANIGREVALKRMLSAGDAESVRRFFFEAQVTGQLEHPGIVPVYELGETTGANGPFLAMKRIRGRSLAEVLDEIRRDRSAQAATVAVAARSSTRTRRRVGRDPSGRTSRTKHAGGSPTRATLDPLLDVFLKVCDAIAYAHSRGVLHRDLKPANIMVGEFGEALVVDWGIAKVLGRESPGGAPPVKTSRGDDPQDFLRTREGQISGTPMYMSPEQARGEIGNLDERSDVYSLGAVLYEILALAPPFEGGNLIRLLTQVTNGSWRPPSENSVAPWPIPRELEAVVARAMSLDQGDRYASASEMRADIAAYISGRTLAAAEYSPWEILIKWARRHRTAVIGGAATAAAVILGIVGTIGGIGWSRRAEADRLRAERIDEATGLHGQAMASQKLAATPFNASDPQPYFLERLPVVVTLGQAIHEHPEPPDAWKRELALTSNELQGRAEEAADWALAEHLALSAVAWDAITDEEGRKRLARTRGVRAERVAADLARLDDLRRRIRETEGRSPEEGGLVPGEMLERARQANAIESRSEVVARLIEEVGRDNARRKGGDVEGRLAEIDRLFCARALGTLGDVATASGGQNAPGLVEETIESARYLGLSEEEVSAWVRTVARLEGATPGCFPGQGARRLLERTSSAWGEAGPVTVAAREGVAFLDAALEGAALSALFSAGSIDSESLIAALGEWAAARATRGAEYTARLLDIALPLAKHTPTDLLPREAGFVLDQIGLRGDLLAPDPGSPERAAVPVLRSVVRATHAMDVTDAAADPSAPIERRLRLAVATAAAVNLARLRDPEGRALLDELRPDDQYHLLFRERTRLAARLLAGEVEGMSEPASAREFEARGQLRRARGDLDGAEADFTRTIELAPGSHVGYFDRGSTRIDRGRFAEAESDFSRAIDLAPGEAAYHGARGIVRARQGKLAGALDDLTRAIELDPVPINFLYSRGEVFRILGDYQAARQDLDRVLELDRGYSHGYRARGEVFEALGDFGAAERDYTRFIELDPNSALAFESRACARRGLGNRDGALADFTRAIELDPAFLAAYHNRGVLRREVGDLRGALADTSRAIDLSPSAEAHYNRGTVQRDLGDHGAAIEDYSRAIELDPRHAEAHFARGRSRHIQGDARGAYEDYTKSIELDPGASRGYLNRGALLKDDLGDLPRAVDDLTRAIEIDQDPYAYVNRADARRVLGDLAGAVEDARKATGLDASLWQAWATLGGVQAISGDRAGAEASFREAIGLAPVEARPAIEAIRREVLGK